MRLAWRLPEAPVPIVFPSTAETPLVSIIIPAFNQWQYTNGCLRALAEVHDAGIPSEVIVVDDASTDGTAELLARCGGIRVVRLDGNRGFGAACNAGAAAARGTYLHFLNNDAFVAAGWLRPLLETFASDERVGAVVSQLRYPNGSLADAGGVIWRDGQGSNYGRGNSPGDWRYRSARDVDYGSAASLMVRAAAFTVAGGFAPEFAPAYYEDTDLCFTLRKNGYRIVYQPRSIVHHAEGASYGSNLRVEARAIQERSRARFAAKWHDALRDHFDPDPDRIERAARRLMGTRTVVVVDEHVPFTDRDAGSRRTFFLIELLRKRGWHVIFGSIDRNDYEPYAGALRDAGTEVICGFGAGAVGALKRLDVAIDAAWLSRQGVAERVLPAFRRHFDAKIAFDTVDLHYVRLRREQEISGKRTGWQSMRQRELLSARNADVTVTTGAPEREQLRAEGITGVYEIPVIEPAPSGAPPGWESRQGIVFLGNYAHAPNVDAAQWLWAAIMPLVWERLPGAHLTLAGADPTRTVRALAGPNVTVTGYVADAGELLAHARVFAAPIRFGAGMKGKIVYALAHGIPVVTTPIGAEGIFDAAGYDAIDASPERLAARIVHLHEDSALWNALSTAGRSIAERFAPSAVERRLDDVLNAL